MCDRRPVKARGLCIAHYTVVRRAGALDDFPLRGRAEPVFVPVCVCDNPDPLPVGECQRCLKPYRPKLMALRAEWRAHLGLVPT